MSDYTKLDASVHCEEIFTVDPDELAEVQRLMVEDDEGWAAYAEWAATLEPTEAQAALEQHTFVRQQERLAMVATANGPMLLKRECLRRDCGYRCNFDIRIGGIAI